MVFYDDTKDDLPVEMKVSPISDIPHKSKAFLSILDFAFALHLIPQGKVPSANENI